MSDFESDWKTWAKMTREEFVASGGAVELIDAVLADAKPFIRRISGGDRPGYVVLELCMRHAETMAATRQSAKAVKH